MIVAEVPILIASLAGVLSGFVWKVRKKTAIKTIIVGLTVAVVLLCVGEYLNMADGFFSLINNVILQGVGLFFYAWGTFNAGKWLGKEFRSEED